MLKKLILLALLVSAISLPVASRAEDTVWSAQNYTAAWSIYNRKYGTAAEALRRAFPGNDKALDGTQVQSKQTGWGVQPTRVVAYAAKVDEPVRGKGEAFVNYLKKPDVHQWYQKNFGLR